MREKIQAAKKQAELMDKQLKNVLLPMYQEKRRDRAQMTQTAEIPRPFYSLPSARKRSKQKQEEKKKGKYV